MKIKTAELTEIALDWAVAKCERVDLVNFLIQYEQRCYRYSTDWSQGGPIIEREAINVVHPISRWLAYTYECKAEEVGPTPLIAAMRCYVASKLGDSVDVPDELL